jgi:indole-3-glycerol phosphate synthase
MSSILDQIVQTKREEVARRTAELPLDTLKERVAGLPRPRNFFQAVTKKNEQKEGGPRVKPLNLIAEVKKASPSAGVIRPDFDPVEVARAYEAAGADALSVLTDEKYFQGHLSYIEAVRAAVRLPVLRKDFIIDPWQVYESRAAGADAILLIAEILETGQLIDLQILATELNMTCLIEVHDLENLMRVRDHVIGFPMKRYSLLGINNRDLRTFKTDLGTTLRMTELVEDRSVLVSESGIHTYADIKKLAESGVSAVLVGESLMRSPDIAAKVRELFNI